MKEFRRRDRQADEPESADEHGRGADLVTSYLTTPQTAAQDDDGFERFGEHVSSVLNAAREAAARIEEEARDEAERIRGQAKAEARSRVEAAREEAEATRNEAQASRAEAEAYAAQQRSEAQAKAKSVVVEAERHAVAMGEEAKRREQSLKMDISLAEDRLRQLALGLHEVAARLDSLLGGPSQSRESDERSLADDLVPSRDTEDVSM